MSYAILSNPDFAGRTPQRLEPACHDRTPFLSFVCLCGERGHLHESQIEGVPTDAVIALRCESCREFDDLLVTDIRQAFADMRAEGWYA